MKTDFSCFSRSVDIFNRDTRNAAIYAGKAIYAITPLKGDRVNLNMFGLIERLGARRLSSIWPDVV